MPAHRGATGGGGGATEQPGEPPFSPALVEELLRRFAKALRTRTLYLPNNPVYQGAVDGLNDAISAVWRETEQITLSVFEAEIRWEGRPVAAESSRQEGLPWLLYKDGVRELTFIRGVEGGELEQLLDILVRARKAAPEEDDLLTLLWEREFLYLRYRFVDLTFEGGAYAPPAAADAQGRHVGDLHQSAEEAPRPGIVRMEDLDASLYFLEEHEIEYLRSEVAAEYRSNLHASVISILLDIIETRGDPDIRAEVADVLDTLVPQLLAGGAYSAVAYLLREVRTMLASVADLPPDVRRRIERLPIRLSSPDVFPQLIRALDEGQQIPSQEDLEALFAELRGETLALVLAAIPKVQTGALRESLEAAGSRLASVNTAELVRLILSPDGSVAMQAINRAGDLSTAAAVGPLGKVLIEGAVEFRQAAAQALAAIGSPGALRVLEQAMDDDDRDVRVTAVRAIGAKLYRAALPRIEEIIRGRAVGAADLTEKMACFESYALLAGASGVELLDSLLSSRGFFSRKADPEVRACAAMALGRIGTEAAMARLRAANDKDVLVRSSINKALRGAVS